MDWNPRRITVAGVSGSGKTTLATRIAERLDLPRVEIDALFHGPGWQPRANFVAEVEAFLAGREWVIEWQYRLVREQIAARADTLVWLDLPTAVTLAQLTRRTILRRLRREELWNGNLEAPLHTVFTDPDHIIRWGIRTRNQLRELMPNIAAAHPHLRIVRLRSRRERDRWLRCTLVR
ncbi:AAA family ATPase [Granulicoccus sp. GXG6511]|uniref:AAA family ATPase n=1 Tax=Granulicoccus sp. GXG6511 TaxID=3381351 RepID=UPI003D7DA6E1